MDEPPAKRARLSESPRADRTGSPGDRFAISGPAISGRPRPSVLASPRIRSESETRRGSVLQGSLSPTLGRLPTPSRHAQLNPPGFSSSSSRAPGSASSSRVPLPSIGQMSTGWTSQVTGYDPGPGPPPRMPPEQSFARTDSLGMIAESHEGSDAGTVGSRDPGRERAPRSMMACVRCRKQKMKCDGPAAAPCRGCKSVNTTCVFETRTRSSRPKSMSTLAPAQPLPAVMSSVIGTPTTLGPPRYGHRSSMSLDPYAHAPPLLVGTATDAPESPRSRQQGLAQMPGPGKASIGGERNPGLPFTPGQPVNQPGLFASYQPRSAHRPSFSTSTLDISRPPPVTGYAVPPPAIGPVTSPETPRAMTAMPQNLYAFETRIRQLESTARNVELLQANQAALQNTVQYLELQVRHLTGQLAETSEMGLSRMLKREKGKQREVYVSERTWDAYRSYISPLSPWLVTLTQPTDLSGEVISALGIRPRVSAGPNEAQMQSRDMVRIELARLVATGEEWSRDDIHALGTLAMWEGNSSLGSLAIGQARDITGRRNGDLGKEMVAARDTVEMILLEHMLWSMQAPCFVPSSVRSSVSSTWRDKVKTHIPAFPTEKDNDVKMLAWIEYAEMLTDVQNVLMDPRQSKSRATSSPRPGSVGSVRSERKMVAEKIKAERLDKRREFLAGWDAWQGRWGQGGDPILALHYHCAILITTSPLLMQEIEPTSHVSPSKTASIHSPREAGGPPTAGSGSSGRGGNHSGPFALWEDLSSDHAGHEMLVRGRDSAVAFIRSICSPEIARTLHYSLPIFRSRLAFAISHILAHSVALPHSTLTALPLHQSTLRLAYEKLGGNAGPPPAWSALGDNSALVEVVRTGDLTLGSTRQLFAEVADGSIEVGRDLWDRVLGK